MKYVIVGGVAGGATVAARLKRDDENAQIVLFEKGKYISYANCGLPYYIGGTIPERDSLFVQTPEGFAGRYDIEVRVRSEVEKIDTQSRKVYIYDAGKNIRYEESYDKLVLSPGAEPFRPDIPGIGHPAVFTLRNIPDTDKIKHYLASAKARRAVIVGGGFIGLEMAENFHKLGIKVSIVEMAGQVMANLDFSMAAIVHSELRLKEVDLFLNDAVVSFENRNGGVRVLLKSGNVLEADLVVLSIGVKPETKLALEAGLALGSTGGIKVNEYLQTSDKNIYAIGDAIEVKNLVTGKPALIPLAGPANKQGRIAADNIAFGNISKYPGSIGTGIAKVFDLTVASTGANSKLLKRDGIRYIASFTHSGSHAGYYPDSRNISVKILFSPEDGKLLGAQVVGQDGVDKRIEMFAMVIRSGGTIYDLMEMEHAYAPPYSSAKDPVNIAGFVADNILSKKIGIIHWREIEKLDPVKDFLLDVRTEKEYRSGAIPGSANIPLNEIRFRLDEIPSDKRIVVYCGIGLRGYLAGRILIQNNFDEVCNLSGGYKTYSAATVKY